MILSHPSSNAWYQVIQNSKTISFHHFPCYATMKKHEFRTLGTLTLDNAIIELKMHHASFSSLLTHETILEEEEEQSCFSNYSHASSKTKPKKNVHFGYVRMYKATNGSDPPGEHSSSRTCDCDYSPQVFCSVDDHERRRRHQKDLHKKDLHLLQIIKAQSTKKGKGSQSKSKSDKCPSRPLPPRKRELSTRKVMEPGLSHFLVVRAREDGSPETWSRNSQCNQVKHDHSSYSTTALHPVKDDQKSKTTLSLPSRLQPSDLLNDCNEYATTYNGTTFSWKL